MFQDHQTQQIVFWGVCTLPNLPTTSCVGRVPVGYVSHHKTGCLRRSWWIVHSRTKRNPRRQKPHWWSSMICPCRTEYQATAVCSILWQGYFRCKKFLNSQLIKVGPLSDTTLSSKPNWTKIALRCWMIACVVIVGIGWTSNHLECASIITRNIWPLKGPAKSKWKHANGQLGHFQGIRGATGGLGWEFRHSWQH